MNRVVRIVAGGCYCWSGTALEIVGLMVLRCDSMPFSRENCRWWGVAIRLPLFRPRLEKVTQDDLEGGLRVGGLEQETT